MCLFVPNSWFCYYMGQKYLVFSSRHRIFFISPIWKRIFSLNSVFLIDSESLLSFKVSNVYKSRFAIKIGSILTVKTLFSNSPYKKCAPFLDEDFNLQADFWSVKYGQILIRTQKMKEIYFFEISPWNGQNDHCELLISKPWMIFLARAC